MIFLIDYDRATGHASVQRFDDGASLEAADARLQLELKLNREGIEHEVVLLQASSEKALHKTHRRYFASVRELAEGFKQNLAEH